MIKLVVCSAVLLRLHSSLAQDYPYPPKASSETCDFAANNDNLRLDCHPEANASEERCVERGCCWRQTVVGHPFCYYPENFAAFEALNETHLTRKYRSQFPADINLLRLEVNTGDHLSFKLVDANNDRFVPPYPKLNEVKVNESKKIPYKVSLHENGHLLKVTKADQIMFSVENSSIVYADQFLQLTFNLPGTLYGVGEHRTRLVLSDDWTKYTLWNHDVGPRENTNLYGSHPFILIVAEDGTAAGLYLHNSNAMEVIIQPGSKVTFRTIGGILDFHYFLGSSPAEVVRQYNQFIGLPAIPPYWGLGFHLCRWGYNSANYTRTVWQRMRDAQIPYDTQWNDIDYMQDNNDFTLSSSFVELPQLVEDMHDVGMHYVVMLDPGVSGSEPEGTYPPYSDGVAMDTFVKDSNGDIFIGHVWNKADTVYPDFTHPRAVEYWTKQLSEFREKIKYDAIWIDMNEPSNFFDGTVNGCPDSNLETPPYVPNVDGGILQTKTLCMTARHAAGNHYDLHNLYSIFEADVTRRAAEDILKKRTFLITRSSFTGIGRYSGHWAGDNYSDWPEMAASIVELLTFSIYGVPFMGSDICGFGGEANKELCNRWMQLGSFYPFSRNHNSIGSKDQDPASFDQELIDSSRKALNVRYSLLPYLYTLFYLAQIEGTTVARPLLFEFPSDSIARQEDRAFLWGSGLYIIPVLESGATSVDAYLPSARWFDYYSGEELKQIGNVTLDAPFDTIPLLLRGGNILPSQSPAVTTTQSRKNPFSFIVVPDEDGNASGSLFWDDGESLDSISKDEIGLLDLNLNGDTFKTTVRQWKTADTPVLGSIKVLGASHVSSVTVNGKSADFTLINEVLTVEVPSIPLNTEVEVKFVV